MIEVPQTRDQILGLERKRMKLDITVTTEEYITIGLLHGEIRNRNQFKQANHTRQEMWWAAYALVA